MVLMLQHNYSLLANLLKYKHNQLQFAISYACVFTSKVVKEKKVKNDHSNLDLANFEAICTKVTIFQLGIIKFYQW